MARKTRAAAAAKQAQKELDEEKVEPEPELEIPVQEIAIPDKQADEVVAIQATTETEPKLTMEERMAKMKDLRKKMAESSMANRKAVASEQNKHKQNAKQQMSQSRKLEKAEKILDKRDAEENGEDWERSRAWGYSIEDNERWEEKLELQEQGKDQGAIDPNSAAERSYRRQIKQFKPDMKAYASQRSSAPSPSTSLITATNNSSSSQMIKRQDLLTSDSPTLTYGEHRPDDAALDRVASHLNNEAVIRNKRSRARADDPDAEVNYINDKNKHFNKKIARFYDEYTTEIRENFERGTAL